jgi:hypothetical protein
MSSEGGVFFAHDFETGELGPWDNLSDPRADHVKVTDDPARVFRGGHSAEMTAQHGPETGGKLVKWFLPGYDQVHARWYCMFAEDFDQGSYLHFCNLMGGTPHDRFAAFGKAGKQPNGTDFFITGLDPYREYGRYPAPGAMGFYTYWPEMKQSGDGHYWGNAFMSDPLVVVERGRWYCMEMMVQCNTPGEHDGEQAAWIDGERVIHVPGLRWRDTDELKIHCFWLELYIHHSPKLNRVWFDEVALSTEYIGPVSG